MVGRLLKPAAMAAEQATVNSRLGFLLGRM
jgi:hypothetical protein